jgi:ABC-type branched-subunit amino acid transport system substrate-binding protein
MEPRTVKPPRRRPDAQRTAESRRGRTKVAVAAVAVVAVVALAACGSGAKSSTATTVPATPTTSVTSLDKTLGDGVTATEIKVGVALVNFGPIEQFTDTIRTEAEQQQIYSIFINNINANGGINGRKIVPIYKFYTPLGTSQILPLCTSFAQDDNVFAVVGTFIDFSGDAQTCIAHQENRVLMTFNLTQAIINQSPPGLIVTAGDIPERSGSILIQLLKNKGLLAGKTFAVLGDTTESSDVNGYIVPALKKAGVPMGSTAILDVGTTGDTTAGQAQLDSFIEKWKTEHVNALILSGDLASTKQFVVKVKQAFPDMALYADTQDVLDQAQQVQKSGPLPNPYDGIITAGGLSPKEYTDSENWKYCSAIYQNATGKVPENALQIKKTADGKIDDTYGTINDACQTMTMFHDIGQRVGPYLNNTNWVYTVDHFGPIVNRGSGPYSSLHTGKYSADDNWRLEQYVPTLGPEGNWNPITPLEDITGS